MGHCRDCRHWERIDSDHGACSYADPDTTSSGQMWTEHVETSEREEYARLYTMEDFGCVQFAAKIDPADDSWIALAALKDAELELAKDAATPSVIHRLLCATPKVESP